MAKNKTPSPNVPGRSFSSNSLPFVFKRNIGQADKRARFLARRPGYNVFLTKTGIVSVLAGISNKQKNVTDNKKGKDRKARKADNPPRSIALHMQFVGANTNVKLSGQSPLTATANAYNGSNAATWVRDIPLEKAVRYQSIYRHTDLYVNSHRGQIAYHFVLAAKGKVGQIKIRFTGTKSVKIDDKGRLQLTLPNGGQIVHHTPKVFEHVNGTEKRLVSRFKMLSDDTIGFEVKGRRPGTTLVIDPQIDFGTYFGGSGSEPLRPGMHRWNPFWIPTLDLALDSRGHLFIGGATLSADLPNAAGSIPPADWMAYAARLNTNGPSGPQFDFVNYFGGSQNDKGFGITVGLGGHSYLCGSTQSSDFPVAGPAFDTIKDNNENEGFVLLMSPNGHLLRTTFIHASNYTNVLACEFDPSVGRDYQTGLHFTGQTGTSDPHSVADPAIFLPTAAQSTLAGANDAFVGKLSADLKNLLHATLLGGTYEDTGTDIAVNGGRAVVTGLSESYDFPITLGAFADHTLNKVSGKQCGDYIHSGQCMETFAARLNASGQLFEFVTFLDDPVPDFGSGVALDDDGNVYISGQRNFGGQSHEAFVTKLSKEGNAELYRLEFARFGGRAHDIEVDSFGVAHVVGEVLMSGYAVGNPVGPSYIGGIDGFYANVDPNGTLMYFSYLGGNADDRGYSLALDGDSCAYLGFETWSDTLNVALPNAPQTDRAGASDVLILHHCNPPDISALDIRKTVSPGITHYGDAVQFTIDITNYGLPIAGPVEFSDVVPLPFKATGLVCPGGYLDGQTAFCTLPEIPFGTTSVRIQSVNELNCRNVAGVLGTINRAALDFPDGTERDAKVDVFFDYCDMSSGLCSGASDCNTNEVCLRKCNSFHTCSFEIGPLCFGRQDHLFTRAAECLPPSASNGNCDRIIP